MEHDSENCVPHIGKPPSPETWRLVDHLAELARELREDARRAILGRLETNPKEVCLRYATLASIIEALIPDHIRLSRVGAPCPACGTEIDKDDADLFSKGLYIDAKSPLGNAVYCGRMTTLQVRQVGERRRKK